MVKKPSRPSQDRAERIAIAALSFIAADPNRLAGVIGHIAADEKLLLAFAAEIGMPPDEIDRARKTLSGPDWERDAP
jgi:hypothetical protein